MEGNIDVLSYAGHQSGRSGSVFSFCCRFGKKKSIKLPSETSVERRCSLFSVKTPVCAPKTELGCLNPQNKPCVSRFSRPCYKHRKQISTQPAGAGRSTNTLTPFFQLWKTKLKRVHSLVFRTKWPHVERSNKRQKHERKQSSNTNILLLSWIKRDIKLHQT